MKSTFVGVLNQSRFVMLGLALVAFVLCMPAKAQVIVLNDNNSVAAVNTASSAGMFDWMVDGTDHLTQQWFWYRIGALGGESGVNTISAPGIVTPDARTLQVTYANPTLSIRVDYLLTGGTPGSGLSQLNESVLVRNLTAAPMDFHFFQYSDFDLSGFAGGDTVALGTNLFGRFNEANQTKGGFSFAETGVTPGANHGQASLFPVILNSLNDGAPTLLSDVAGTGPGDATWAFQWDVTIPASGSFTLSKVKYITVVPEPTTMSLALLGFAFCSLLRRKGDNRA
jgi:hypothetical protein